MNARVTPPPSGREAPRHSAGVLLYHRGQEGLRLLLIHPGGPYWRARDAGAWQIPKGKIEAGETPIQAAMREAEEELGIHLSGTPEPLGRVRQSGGKLVEAFALEQWVDADHVEGNSFELEWPPHSGRIRTYREVDAARWMTPEEAQTMMLPSQRPLIDMLCAMLEH